MEIQSGQSPGSLAILSAATLHHQPSLTHNAHATHTDDELSDTGRRYVHLTCCSKHSSHCGEQTCMGTSGTNRSKNKKASFSSWSGSHLTRAWGCALSGPRRGRKQTIQTPVAKCRSVSTPHVWAELGIRAPRWKQNNIGNPSQKGRSVTHRFSMCGNCTHSVKGTFFSTFYSRVHIIPGLCILTAKGILAIVTVILIASICLSDTLFLFVWGVLFSCREVEKRMWGEWSRCLRLELCSCPNYRLSLFISLPHPSVSSVL